MEESNQDFLPDNEQDELYEHHRIIVDPGQEPLRIDKFLLHRLSNTSRSKIQAATEAESILVNGKVIKPSYKVKPGDDISIVLSYPPRDTTIHPENIPLNIAFEDDQIVIINKLAGMVVHPGYNNFSGTLVNALVYHFQNLPTHKNGEVRPGLVHRIDKDTSGLLVIAKTEMAMTHLAKQFFDHSIERTYTALVWGDVKADKGTITGHIGHSLKNRKVMDVFADGSHGKHAITHYQVLERFGYVTLIKCNLETGRTHQIRAHMKHIGHPLFGDTTYGGDKALKGPSFNKYKQFVDNCFKMLPRQALHAKTLGFMHPSTHKRMEFDSVLAPDLLAVIEKWRHYSELKEVE